MFSLTQYCVWMLSLCALPQKKILWCIFVCVPACVQVASVGWGEQWAEVMCSLSESQHRETGGGTNTHSLIHFCRSHTESNMTSLSHLPMLSELRRVNDHQTCFYIILIHCFSHLLIIIIIKSKWCLRWSNSFFRKRGNFRMR